MMVTLHKGHYVNYDIPSRGGVRGEIPLRFSVAKRGIFTHPRRGNLVFFGGGGIIPGLLRIFGECRNGD